MNTTKNPLSGDWDLAFQTHALQMILFGPFYVRPQTVTVRYEIVSLQYLYYYLRDLSFLTLFTIIIYLLTDDLHNKDDKMRGSIVH